MSLVIDLIGQLNCHVIGCKTAQNCIPVRVISERDPDPGSCN